MSRPIDGSRILYSYLQRDLQDQDVWLFQMLATRLVTAFGIWFSPELYSQIPILVPYAARHEYSRGNKKLGLPDQWGSPDDNGVFRDDNSLIKKIPSSLDVKSSGTTSYRGGKIGTGFIASHVWRMTNQNELAVRNRLTYSFVPNLVWFPSEVAKLTDREGSFTQNYVQAISRKLYRDVPVPRALQPFVDRSWSLLPDPQLNIPESGLPDLEGLNTFQETDTFVKRRKRIIHDTGVQIRRILSDSLPTGKIVSARYTEGLPLLPPDKLVDLADDLTEYVEAIS